MSKILNLGVLAHVDAGKTSLTERILFESGAINALGSVDGGTTLTDSKVLEQQRGITIWAAVASLSYNDCHINLIDTPGHPDFIAEVERNLPGISRGEGDLDYWHHGWQPIPNDPPSRPRTDHNPLDRTGYLSRLAGRFET